MNPSRCIGKMSSVQGRVLRQGKDLRPQPASDLGQRLAFFPPAPSGVWSLEMSPWWWWGASLASGLRKVQVEMTEESRLLPCR